MRESEEVFNEFHKNTFEIVLKTFGKSSFVFTSMQTSNAMPKVVFRSIRIPIAGEEKNKKFVYTAKEIKK